MAAHAKYPTPHAQLLELAALAKKNKVSFEVFWEEAVRPGQTPVTWATPEERRPIGCVVWPRDTTDRNVSIAATLGARDGWERAFLGKPPSREERALARLAPGLEALDEVSARRAELEEQRALPAGAAVASAA